MPGISGIDVAGIIAADPRIAGTPVVMLTSCDDRSSMRAAKENGVRAFTTKPVRKLALHRAILRALAAKTPATPTPRAGERAQRTRDGMEPPPEHRVRLLLVEDNEDNRKLVVHLLDQHGYSCDIATNGLEAMDRLAERDYPLVLMDCQMPLMDGFQAAAAIRRREREHPRRMPIVAMTAHALAEDREKCLAAGMDDYLSKPFKEAELIAGIQSWLVRGRNEVPGPEAPALPRIQVRAREGLEALIPGYLSNLRRDLLSLAEAVRNVDMKTAGRIGHGMKGSGGGYGFPPITEIGRGIEDCAGERDTAGIEREMATLENYLSRLDVI